MSETCKFCGRESLREDLCAPCRDEGRQLRPIDEEIEETILRIASSRGPDKSLCPSAAARELDTDNWRSIMDRVWAAVGRLFRENKIVVSQNGERVNPFEFNGPVRLSVSERTN